MREGRNINAFAQELKRQSESRLDYVVPTPEMTYMLDERTPSLVSDLFTVSPTLHAERQLVSALDMPSKYYKMLKEDHPDLLVRSVNTLMQERPCTRMVRTLDGRARAVLSDRYRIIDNFEVVETVLPVLAEHSAMEIVSAEITEKKCYLKAVFPKIKGDLGLNDIVHSGIVISNSEVGVGSFSVQHLVYRLVCLNGMIAPGRGTTRRHVGRSLGGEDAYIYSEETVQADDRALMLQIRDIVQSALNPDHFHGLVDNMKATKDNKITGNPVKAIEVVRKKNQLTETEGAGLMRHLIEGGDLSQFGLINAVTRYSQDVEDYDRATQLEALGGEILCLETGEWKQIAEAE